VTPSTAGAWTRSLTGPPSHAPSYPTTYTLWTNLEIGGEHWTRRGFAIRCFVGYAVGKQVEAQLAATDVSPLAYPYTGVGIGYAF
jgi:hypothetical protein